ncbi:hypothetical protein SAY87_029078 [Trapa incisa]|uniref:Zinc finger CCCH domain-containing protein 44 n=1 Tax=Trapa incisa TaxID=236973 RepID=A0AAN7KZ01_9MYRT|nr:hypothetical protein SAY87_029078 [Trapa incisa]
MDLLKQEEQQQRRQEQILSLFGSIEDRELHRSDSREPMGPDQFAAPCELTEFHSPEAHLAGPAAATALVSSTYVVTDVTPTVVAMQFSGVVNVKRKRGRPPKNASALNGQSSSYAQKRVGEEEDVCFICFDGGSLVLCDRKDCPKAYHPACIKRDESFFQSTAMWMCGMLNCWHQCSTCGKGAYYMCYTCTYSLCKNCTKNADFVCVRGPKGLCGTCKKTIMLIEKIYLEDQEVVQVDFDDKTSWEYLFKVYWVILKERLSLTINELTQAKNPWVEPSFAISTREPSWNLSNNNVDKRNVSVSTNENQSARVLRCRKAKEQPKLINVEGQVNPDERPCFSQGTKWASDELLEFVAHMRNGDTSVLCQFDVQALLLEYIRKNNLRDTQRKCQIVCDARLLNLFGRMSVGHFEMLKLLDSHFLVKDNPKVEAFIRGSIVDIGTGHVGNSLSNDNQLLLDNNKRRRGRKKVGYSVQQVDPNDYAAADVHNVSLIYLRRHMIEKLLDDPEQFYDKVVGSIVRIKVSGGEQNQDIYRLVQVIGTSKVAESYKFGEKMSDIVLEILNLEMKEVMPIDKISDQEFSQDECGELNQSIKHGEIKWLTVGDLQQKALKLHELRVNEWLETELLRLNHIRDGASEKGEQKELRECVEKIQLLSSPEERQRRLHEIPEVHAYQSMSLNHISQNKFGASRQKKQDGLVRQSNGPGRKRRQAVTARSANSVPMKRTRASLRNQTAASDSDRESSVLTNEMNKRRQSDHDDLVMCALTSSSGGIPQSGSGVASEVARSPLSSGMSINDAEIHKIWHYQDPTGKTQGPFTLAQLRKWNGSGHFPIDLRIWRIDGRREDSILLIGALNGSYSKQEPRISSGDRIINLNGSNEASPTQRDINIAEDSTNSKEGLHPPSKVVQGMTSSEGRIITVAEVWNSLNDDAQLSLAQPVPQLCSSSQLPGKKAEHSLQGNGSQERNQDSGNLRLFGYTEVVPPSKDGHNGTKKPSNGGTQPSHLWGSWDGVSGSNTISLDKSLETNQEKIGFNFLDAPSTSVMSHNRSLNNAEGDEQSLSSNLQAQDPAPAWGLNSGLLSEATMAKGVTDRWGDGCYSSVPPKPVDEWDLSLRPGTPLRPTDIPGNDSSLTLSGHPTIIGSSQAHQPLPLESSWQAIMNETSDFATLGEESVSDLLAEVEAMENAGLPSPTSAMKCSYDLNDDGKVDCFSPIEGFDPTTGLVKSEVFTSTVNMMVTSQPTITTGEPRSTASIGDLVDAGRTNYKHPTSSAEPQRVCNHWKSAGSELPSISPPQTTWQLPRTSPHSWEAVQGSSHWDLTDDGHASMDWEVRQDQYQRTGTGSIISGSGSGSPGIWSDQQRYSSGSGRYTSPRDRGQQGTDQGQHGRSSGGPWSSSSSGRQYPGGSSVGGCRRQTPKGQRVCKFYESGYCKRGASCSYFHP